MAPPRRRSLRTPLPTWRFRSLAAQLLALSPLLAPVAAPAQAAPATEAEMALYSRFAAYNTCIGRAAGEDFDKAAAIAGETIAQIIQVLHQGAIQQVGPKPLGAQELRQGAVNSAVLGAAELCPKQLPPEVLRKAEAVLRGDEAKPAATKAAESKSAPSTTLPSKPTEPRPAGQAGRP